MVRQGRDTISFTKLGRHSEDADSILGYIVANFFTGWKEFSLLLWTRVQKSSFSSKNPRATWKLKLTKKYIYSTSSTRIVSTFDIRGRCSLHLSPHFFLEKKGASNLNLHKRNCRSTPDELDCIDLLPLGSQDVKFTVCPSLLQVWIFLPRFWKSLKVLRGHLERDEWAADRRGCFHKIEKTQTFNYRIYLIPGISWICHRFVNLKWIQLYLSAIQILNDWSVPNVLKRREHLGILNGDQKQKRILSCAAGLLKNVTGDKKDTTKLKTPLSSWKYFTSVCNRENEWH